MQPDRVPSGLLRYIGLALNIFWKIRDQSRLVFAATFVFQKNNFVVAQASLFR